MIGFTRSADDDVRYVRHYVQASDVIFSAIPITPHVDPKQENARCSV